MLGSSLGKSVGELPTGTGTVAVTPLPALPSELSIPRLGIAAEIEQVGLDQDKAMDVPSQAQNVAWYMLGAVPGQKGNAVVAGHFDSKTGPAVFYKLNEMQPGDKVAVTDADGKNISFVVERIETYPEADFPLQEVFGETQEARLNLITCTGIYNLNSQNYSHRTVVYTVLDS